MTEFIIKAIVITMALTGAAWIVLLVIGFATR